MMFPSLRGGNENPGNREGFLGEVNDILAAAAFLRQQPFVDPNRIYLGGHSTGGTLALLTAECADPQVFRAVFSFGPTDDAFGHGLEYLPCNLTDSKELLLRSPARWLHSIQCPVFVIEGSCGNASSLRAMAKRNKNKKVHFFEIKGANHFDILGSNQLIAERILKDTGSECNVAFNLAEFKLPVEK